MAGPAPPAEVGVVAGTPKRPVGGPLADGEDEGVPDGSLQLAVAILRLVSALCVGLGCGHGVPFSVQRRWAASPSARTGWLRHRPVPGVTPRAGRSGTSGVRAGSR